MAPPALVLPTPWMYASVVPSGENASSLLLPLSLTRVASVPSLLTNHT
jgi:hypothetical protein